MEGGGGAPHITSESEQISNVGFKLQTTSSNMWQQKTPDQRLTVLVPGQNWF